MPSEPILINRLYFHFDSEWGHHSSKLSGMAKKKSDTRSQATRILEARKAGTDESGRKFREAMGKATLQKQARKPRG